MKNLILLVFCVLSLMSCNAQPDVEPSPTSSAHFNWMYDTEVTLYKDGSYLITSYDKRSSQRGFYIIREDLDKITLYNTKTSSGPSTIPMFNMETNELRLSDINKLNELKK